MIALAHRMQLFRFRPDGLNNKAGSNSMSRNPRILIVEDEEPLTMLLRYNIEAEGYSVDSSARGDEA